MSKMQRVLVRIVLPAQLGCLAGAPGVVLGMLLAALVGGLRGWQKPRGFTPWQGACCLALASALTGGFLGAMGWLMGWPVALPWSAAALWFARSRRVHALAVAL